jgi:hypothetical protein
MEATQSRSVLQNVVIVTAHGPDYVHAYNLTDGSHLGSIRVSCPTFAVSDVGSRTVFVSGWGHDDELCMLQVHVRSYRVCNSCRDSFTPAIFHLCALNLMICVAVG